MPSTPRPGVLPRLLFLLALVLLSGCEASRYYGQLVHGQLEVIRLRQPVEHLLADARTDPALRERLAYTRQVLDFATDVLHLPVGDAYSSYSDLGRNPALWALYAAPIDSIHPVTWCYPIAGCAHYRGYFDRDAAARHAAVLGVEGLDTHVAGVRAYSTLGWFSDPLLNTFVFDDDIDLAALLFHELAHQVVYLAGDTAFNEGFATFVEREGLSRWVKARGRPEALAEYQARQDARDRFVQLVGETRQELAALYARSLPEAEMRRRKQMALQELVARFESASATQPELARYQGWISRGLNNAKLATVATYHDHVPAFARLFKAAGNDFPAFFESVRELAGVDPARRAAALSGR